MMSGEPVDQNTEFSSFDSVVATQPEKEPYSIEVYKKDKKALFKKEFTDLITGELIDIIDEDVVEYRGTYFSHTTLEEEIYRLVETSLDELRNDSTKEGRHNEGATEYPLFLVTRRDMHWPAHL